MTQHRLTSLARGLALLALAVAGFAGPAPAQEIRARQNIDYRLIQPQPVETGERIEVIDFFWYGCPHCNELQPALEGWVKRKPADVVLRRVPAILRDSWAPHARIYYTLEQLGEVGAAAPEGLLQLPRRGAAHEQARRDGASGRSANGIDRERWLDAYYFSRS